MIEGAGNNLLVVLHIFDNQEIDPIILFIVYTFSKDLSFILTNKIKRGMSKSSISDFVQFFGGVCTDIWTDLLL